ncbi:LOW QUALITY PROTEIN: hypothetical protein PHMEG_00012661 [Phytophthora megakarya]|uniref:Uncharacterized protein n=1 Tax=Phytophthora megakarya TaxID=4795 RepID=A0A225W853_9STRA|nr:LOW QUALITY PROTEIN: hypothetical protein PHMEG_00012661 [Phytophthora megakarya]
MKDYELLMMLLETCLIEMSDSAWASPITILSNNLLSLIDDLLVSFEQAVKVHGTRYGQQILGHTYDKGTKRISALPPEEEKMVDAAVLEFLGLDLAEENEVQREKFTREVPILTNKMGAFKRNIPVLSQMSPVLGRNFYIDDIAHGDPTWDQLCKDLNTLLYCLRYWNVFVSLQKSKFDILTIPYLLMRSVLKTLGPKIANSVQELPLPRTKGILNYCHKFIEDFSVVASALHELTDEQIKAGSDLPRSKESFEILSGKACLHLCCVTRPEQAEDPTRTLHRSGGRVLNEIKIRYHEAEKEVIAITQALDVFENLVQGCPTKVYTRNSVMPCYRSPKKSRTMRPMVIIFHWDLEVHKVQSDEDGCEHLDEVDESLISLKGRVKPQPVISVEMLEADFDGYVLSLDGTTKTFTRQGICGCIIWKLPGWKVVTGQGFTLKDVTFIDAEYHGLFKGLAMVAERDIPDVVVVGDSRILIQQVQGLINGKPNLQRRLEEYGVLREKFKSARLVHVKSEYNQAADYLTSKALALRESWTVVDPNAILESVSSIPEKLMKPMVVLVTGVNDHVTRETPLDESVKTHPGPESAPLQPQVMAAVMRSRFRKGTSRNDPMGPLGYQAETWSRIKVHQDEDRRLLSLKEFFAR